MELVKKKIRTNILGKTVADQFMIDDDYNVPDSKRDVGRVVSGEGILKIEEVKKVENYLRVTGKLYFKILYVTDEGEPGLSSLEGKMPFEEMVYMDEETDGDYVVQAGRVEFTASVIHSRKLSLKAVAELSIHTERGAEEDTTVDVDSGKMLYKNCLLYTSRCV